MLKTKLFETFQNSKQIFPEALIFEIHPYSKNPLKKISQITRCERRLKNLTI
jgi:hypothetical protein